MHKDAVKITQTLNQNTKGLSFVRLFANLYITK